jgi:DNA-binding IclR family transcriptional regulator
MIEEFVRLLEDGAWHSFSEIKAKTNLPEDQFREVTQFLKNFDLADIDGKQERVKIMPSFLELPRKRS